MRHLARSGRQMAATAVLQHDRTDVRRADLDRAVLRAGRSTVFLSAGRAQN
jgi:hypothetical protein